MKKKTIGEGERKQTLIKICDLYYYFYGIESNWKVIKVSSFFCILTMNIEKDNERRIEI